jgi:HEAT repeats
MRGTLVCLLLLATAPQAPAEGPKAKGDDRSARVDYWVEKLGDEDPKIRLAAAEELRKIGNDAVPALNQAARSKDPEVRTRAAATLKQIEQDAAGKPDGVDVLPPPQDNPGNGRGMRLGRVPAAGGDFAAGGFAGGAAVGRFGDGGFQTFNRNLVVTENGRTVRIQEDNDGITVTITEMIGGKTVTRASKAKDVESLKKEHPEAAKIYEQYASRMQLRMNHVLTPQMLAPPARLGGLDLPPAQRQEIEDAYAEARRALEEHRKAIEQHRQVVEDQLKAAEEIRRQAIEEIYRAQVDRERER